ncbi:MAG TPA: hypothetical protein VE870_15710 [Bacteroidales bacterium]|nr:hypothetical protein [Bacteroidales bacterium]
MKKIILSIVILTITLSAAGPDKRFKLKHEEDNVKVYYRWKKKFSFTGKDERTLLLYLANENDYRVMVTFSIDIYKNAFLSSSSDTLSYCIPPNYEISGNFRDLEFSTRGTALDSTKSDDKEMVEWEINDFSVARNETCTTRANWR